jgi:MOSC domain-containing protein YiiM
MRSFEELEAMIDDIRAAPTPAGIVVLIVRRPAVDEREVVDEARLDVAEGLVGDTWRERGNRHTPDGSGDPEAQLTVMNARAAAAVAGDVSQWPLAGDQVYVDFDISTEHLPAGTRLAIGEAEIEVSKTPHTGCAKYSARFGKDALRFVSTPEGRALRLRGMNARITKSGTVRVGDPILIADAMRS